MASIGETEERTMLSAPAHSRSGTEPLVEAIPRRDTLRLIARLSPCPTPPKFARSNQLAGCAVKRQEQRQELGQADQAQVERFAVDVVDLPADRDEHHLPPEAGA